MLVGKEMPLVRKYIFSTVQSKVEFNYYKLKEVNLFFLSFQTSTCRPKEIDSLEKLVITYDKLLYARRNQRSESS